MVEYTGEQDSALVLEHLDDALISFLDVEALKVRDLVGETAVVIKWHHHFRLTAESGSDADTVIILTKGWGLVDGTGTGISSDIFVTENLETCITLSLDKVVKERCVLFILEVSSQAFLSDCELLLGPFCESLDTSLEDPVGHSGVVFDGELVVVEFRMDTDGKIGRECPRGGGPSNHASFWVLNERERDDTLRVVDVLVVETGFEV